MNRSPVLVVLVVAAVAVLAWGIVATLMRPSGEAVASPTPSAAAHASPTTPVAAPSPTASPSASPTAETEPTDSPEPSDTPEPARSPEYESPEDLVIGDCYDPIEDPDDDALLAAIILPCAEPHLAEVFGLAEVAGAPTAPFPGYDDLESEAEDRCDAAFEEYVGIDFDRSRYGYIYYTPTEATWAAGDRIVMCVIDDNGRAIEGSVAGTRR